MSQADKREGTRPIGPTQDHPEMDLKWRESGACHGQEQPALFYPEERYEYGTPEYEDYRGRLVDTFCSDCPVRQACFAHSVAWPEEWGTWGGQDKYERRQHMKHGTWRCEADYCPMVVDPLAGNGRLCPAHLFQAVEGFCLFATGQGRRQPSKALVLWKPGRLSLRHPSEQRLPERTAA